MSIIRNGSQESSGLKQPGGSSKISRRGGSNKEVGRKDLTVLEIPIHSWKSQYKRDLFKRSNSGVQEANHHGLVGREKNLQGGHDRCKGLTIAIKKEQGKAKKKRGQLGGRHQIEHRGGAREEI